MDCKSNTWLLGLDVRKDSIAIAVADARPDGTLRGEIRHIGSISQG